MVIWAATSCQGWHRAHAHTNNNNPNGGDQEDVFAQGATQAKAATDYGYKDPMPSACPDPALVAE